MTLRILLADDHTVLTAGLRDLLDREPDLEVVGAVGNGAEAVEMAAARQPHVVVMDVSMPGMNGIEATRRIVAAHGRTAVLCLSMHAERQFVIAVLKAGASGYLLKDCAATELIGAVRTVGGGRTYLSPSIAGLVVEACTATAVAEDGGSAFGTLTGREREVLQLLAEGRSARAIAARLQLSVKTVGTHRQHAMRKLGIHNLAGLTKYAIREGLTTTDPDLSD